MTGCGIDRRGPKDSENAHNSFLAKINEKGFWRFVPDMISDFTERKPCNIQVNNVLSSTFHMKKCQVDFLAIWKFRRICS